MLKQAAFTSALNGHHSGIPSRRHTLVRKLSAQFGTCVSEGKSHGASDGEQARGTHRPQRPKHWQQPSRQGKQQGLSINQPGLVPKNFAGRAPQQVPTVEKSSSPPQITTFIKQQEQTALDLARGPCPEAGLSSFCASMDGLLSRSGLRTNYIHFSAVIAAAAHIWTEAQRNDRFRESADACEKLKALFQRCLHSLQALRADLGARQISNVLWSSAILGFNVDDAVPGMVHALTVRFLRSIDAAEEKQRPNAQAAANVLWAIATMGHPAATAQVVGTICLHFGCLTQHSDAAQRPTAQACANVLLALAKLGHSSAAASEVVDSVCLHFAHLMGSPNVKQRPAAQAVANLVWALGTLKHTPTDDRLLTHFCAYMLTLLRSQDEQTCPKAQNIANMLWALAQLKYAPSHDVVTAMFNTLVALCQTPGLQPKSQAISNSLLACAELGLGVKSHCVKALVKHLLVMHVSMVDQQAYSNVAWSLAVMGCLDMNTFETLLDKLTTLDKLSVQKSGSQSSSAQLSTANIYQLYQALAWLRPYPGSKQMQAWSSLRSRLQAVAPEPAARKVSLPGQAEMQAALELQGVPYKAQVSCDKYQADAVLSPHGSNVDDVILVLEIPADFIKNVPNRVLGPVAFRNQLLARYGTVVLVPYSPGNSTAESMAGDIKAAVEAKTGLPLDSFRS